MADDKWQHGRCAGGGGTGHPVSDGIGRNRTDRIDPWQMAKWQMAGAPVLSDRSWTMHLVKEWPRGDWKAGADQELRKRHGIAHLEEDRDQPIERVTRITPGKPTRSGRTRLQKDREPTCARPHVRGLPGTVVPRRYHLGVLGEFKIRRFSTAV